MKKTTVVIPNWNGMKFLKTCMDALMRQDTDDFEILVIDNASSDESVSFIRSNYPNVRVEVMEENLGFAGGVNEGIRLSETPYVLLLNNDTEADPSFVGKLTEAIDSDPRIFSVSACMLKFYDREHFDDAGDLYTVLGWGAQRAVDQPKDAPKYRKRAEVFSACAGAAIYRKAVFDEIGLFDRNHFAYLEDIDVGYRALIYGYRNVYEPEAVVYHIGSGTTGSKYNDFKVRLSARNNDWLIRKNMPKFQRGLNALPLFVGRSIKKSFFRKKGFLNAYTEGLREAEEKKDSLNVVPYRKEHFRNYVRIEGMLIANSFTYAAEYLKRQLKKRKETPGNPDA